MRVVLLGATGKVGAAVREELRLRGHATTAVSRHPDGESSPSPSRESQFGDVFDPRFLERVITGADVVVCSVALRDSAQKDRTPVELIERVAVASCRERSRLVTLGGAGSLKNSDGVDLVDTEEFPAPARPESLGFRRALSWLKEQAPDELRWTMVSPPLSIEVDSPRTGVYRVAGDTLVVASDGRSRISAADLAVAVVDQVESVANVGSRIAVGY